MRSPSRLLCFVAASALFSAAALTSCRPDNRNVDKSATAQQPRSMHDMTDCMTSYTDSLIGLMDIDEKIGQLFMPAVYSSDDIYTLDLIRRYAERLHIGGIILLKGTSQHARFISDSIRSFSRIPPFISIDAEWGLGMRLDDAPVFPTNSELSKSANEQLMFDYGREIARECRLIGINMVMGPVLDVAVKDSFIGRRSYGEDPSRVADLGVAYSRGLEDGNVISVAKHFPGHGSVNTDSHARLGAICRSLNEMLHSDLYPFQRYINQRLSAIMVGHLSVPALDYDDRPAAMSHTVITDLLREDMGFGGLVLTDAMNMGAAKGFNSVDALKAGADIVLAPQNTEKEIDAVKKAVEAGVISEWEINEKLVRILRLKYRFAEIPI